METKDIIDLLITLLERNFDVHMNIIWATVGFLLAAIGWVITSREARAFLSGSETIRVVSIIMLALIAIIHYSLLVKTLLVSMELTAQLTSLVKEPLKGIVNDNLVYSISQTALVIRALVTLVLFSLLGFLVFKVDRNT